MRQFAPLLYRISKTIYSILTLVYVLLFLVTREGYPLLWAPMVFDGLLLIMVWWWGFFLLQSLFQHGALLDRHSMVAYLLFGLMLTLWTGGVFYLFYYLSYGFSF